MFKIEDEMNNILLGVGPTQISPEAILAFKKEIYDCEHEATKNIVMGLEKKINYLFNCSRCSFVIPGTGSTGMEACLTNLIIPKDVVVVCVNGTFGKRIADIASILKAHVIKVESNIGEGVDLKKLEDILSKYTVKLVCLVHVETSTGTMDSIENVSKLTRKYGTLFLLDAVASLGGCDLCLDKFEVDMVYSTTQKCLNGPAGLTIISCTNYIMNYLKKTQSRRSWCWDFVNIYEHVQRGVYPFTTPISLIYTLDKILDSIATIGVYEYYDRQYECSEMIKNELCRRGFRLVTNDGYEAPMLKVFMVPEGVDVFRLKKRLQNDFGIMISTGLGSIKEKTIRIGTMGNSAKVEYVSRLINAIDICLGGDYGD